MKKALFVVFLVTCAALLLMSCATTPKEVEEVESLGTYSVTLTITGSDVPQTIVLQEAVVPTTLLRDAGILPERVTGIAISETVVAIEKAAFANCINLVSVAMPDSLTRIEAEAFSGCRSLAMVALGTGVVSIGSQAFSNTAITNILLPAKVSSVATGAFRGAKNLASIEVDQANPVYQSLDGNLYSKDGSVFYLCPEAQTTAVDIRQGTVRIADQALFDCTRITQVVLHGPVKGEAAGLEKIGVSAFSNCTSLQSILMPDSIATVEAGAFLGCTKLASVRLSENLKAVSDMMFKGCSSIPFIDFPAKVASIGKESFMGCSSLDGALTIPGTVLSVGDSAFSGCTQMDLALIKEGVKTLGGQAFARCDDLTVVVLPSTLSKIAANTFMDATHISSVSAPYWITDRNSDLFKYCRNITITGKGPVPELAFKGNESLVNVIIDPGVTEVGRMSFMGCSNLQSILVSGTVSRILSSSFYGCSKLENLILDNGITRIEDSAFAYCTSLRGVILPATLSYLGSAAFAQCSALYSVAFPLAEATIDKLALSDTDLGYIVFSSAAKSPVGYPWGNINAHVVNEYFEIPEPEDGEIIDLLQRSFSEDQKVREAGRSDLNNTHPQLYKLAKEIGLFEVGDSLLTSMN